MIKIIFFDIDGTLRDFATGKIPESAKEAIHRAKAAGILTAIATGRHLLEVQQETLLEDLRFDAYVTMNGQYCYDQNDIIFANPIPREQVQRLVAMEQEEPFPCIFLEADDMYINMENDVIRRIQEEIKTAMPPLRPVEKALEHPVYQMIPCLEEPRASELMKRLDGCQAMRWSDGPSFDVICKGISKEVGIQKVLEHYGLSQEACAAVGDGYNDIGMLRYVGLGVAMGNAKDELKQVADYVSGSIDQDGLCQAVAYIMDRVC